MGAYGAKPLGDTAEMTQSDEIPSNRFLNVPPTQNNVAYYVGSFADRRAPMRAIRREFPGATIAQGSK